MKLLVLRPNIRRQSLPMLRQSATFAPLAGTSCGATTYVVATGNGVDSRLSDDALRQIHACVDAVDAQTVAAHRLAAEAEYRQPIVDDEITDAFAALATRAAAKSSRLASTRNEFDRRPRKRSREEKAHGVHRTSSHHCDATASQKEAIHDALVALFNGDATAAYAMSQLFDTATVKLNRGKKAQRNACHWQEAVGDAWLIANSAHAVPNLNTLRSHVYRDTAGWRDYKNKSLNSILATDVEIRNSVGERTPLADELREQLGDVGLLIAAQLGRNLTHAVLRCGTQEGAAALAGVSVSTAKRRYAAARLAVASCSGVAVGRQWRASELSRAS